LPIACWLGILLPTLLVRRRDVVAAATALLAIRWRARPQDQRFFRHCVYLHPVSTQVTRQDGFNSLSRSSRWLGSLGPLRLGTFAGCAGQWLWWRRRRTMRAHI